MTQPSVTVAITTYKRPQAVRRAIQSVLAQTYQPLEIIVVEDGSASDLQNWLRAEGLAQIRYVRHTQNRGLSAARNTALNLARGEYIAYLDDDDTWHPDKLTLQMQLARRRPECQVIYCEGVTVDEAGQALWRHQPRLSGDIRAEIERQGLKTVASSALFQATALRHLGGYDETLRSHIDHDIWMAMADMGYQCAYVDCPLTTSYYTPAGRMTSDYRPRIVATDVFLQKWQPALSRWFGPERARQYCQDYYTRVVCALGLSQLEQGQLARGMACYGRVVAKAPAQLYTYRVVVGSAGRGVLKLLSLHRLLKSLLTTRGQNIL